MVNNRYVLFRFIAVVLLAAGSRSDVDVTLSSALKRTNIVYPIRQIKTYTCFNEMWKGIQTMLSLTDILYS